ncbi:ArsR/SmtB family transcription factor [Actinomadura verrucosospora]|uniref:ArsR family transcriptional regulator n=1 Tax=Actinomadura verrucosospora TaxID=46165 RepID=A0A7D3ZWW7_ACTVE|nr:winged helix-turn-helix domain-containing protein [Actinomadura verrucosospora]QKG21366.1 ArsR family transcriptional regulator [Actinomadura verrucosospora]
MLRIHFTGEDLSRTRLAKGPDAMWETVLSLYRLRRVQGAVVFGHWRRAVRAKVPADARLLTELVPSSGYAVDFLTPATATGTLRDGMEALRATPARRLHEDVTELAARHPGRPVPAWAGGLARGERGTLERVADAVSGYTSACLAPYWDRVAEGVGRDLAMRRQTLAEAGWPGVLAAIHPSARWDSPVLELAYPADHDIVLDGRGLVLQPSFFCWGQPVTLLDTALPPVLAYPVTPRPDWAGAAVQGDDARAVRSGRALAALLGHTRARVLEAMALGECTTTQLAARTDLPLPTASRHASVLRDAGLIGTERDGQGVRHHVTALGRSLLEGRPG